MSCDLAVQLGPLELKNPVICGSGEHVATEEGILAALDAGAAAVVAKSANESEAARRQFATAEWILIADNRRRASDGCAPESASLLNRSGLVPIAWERWLEILTRMDVHARAHEAWVVASLIPADPDELIRLASDVEAAGLRWLELNLSAPHAGEAPEGAIERVAGAARVRELTARVRSATSLPLTVKLTAESDDLVALAAAAREAGADAIVMTGRHMALLPDLETRRPLLGTFGAIGGPWALPLVLRWVAKTRFALGAGVPLVATNGVRDGGDAARCLLAGATATQVATAVLTEGPSAITRILGELETYLKDQATDARAIIGEAADAVLSYEEAAVRADA